MQYLFQDGAVRETNYDQETLDAFAALDDERRPVFLPETDPRVVAFLVAQPTQKSIDAKKVDADVDAIYATVSNRKFEYDIAEMQAQAYKDAGYKGEVPPFVASWATASGMKPSAAADSILAKAAAWRETVETVRAKRFLTKNNITNDVPTAMADWDNFVANLQKQLEQ